MILTHRFRSVINNFAVAMRSSLGEIFYGVEYPFEGRMISKSRSKLSIDFLH